MYHHHNYLTSNKIVNHRNDKPTVASENLNNLPMIITSKSKKPSIRFVTKLIITYHFYSLSNHTNTFNVYLYFHISKSISMSHILNILKLR